MNTNNNDDGNPDEKSDLEYKKLLKEELIKQIKEKINKDDDSFKKSLKYLIDESEKKQ